MLLRRWMEAYINFSVETLNKIDRLTIALLETPGVNGWQVLSISHPKMRNIEISSAGIQALPLFFPMKFQAEMAFLLALVLFLHIVGGLVFIPSIVSLLKPRFAVLQSARPTPVS